ncbi:hypothetical protein P261_02116 [Lachnospiraceae bacterium TWA4]|nr:hypothetical protein P261_02116 [Lachnospiraceae bacterium TWA4]
MGVDDTYYLISIEAYIDNLEKTQKFLKETLIRDFENPLFIDRLKELGYGEIYERWHDTMYIDSKDRVGDILKFLKEICPEKSKTISIIYFGYIKMQPAYWLKQHIDWYSMDLSMEHIIIEPLEEIEFQVTIRLEVLQRNYLSLCEIYDQFKYNFMNNPWMYQLNIYQVSRYRITSEYPDAYFTTLSNGQFVPIGWLKSQSDDSKVLNKIEGKFRIETSQCMENLKKQVTHWQEDMKESINNQIQNKNFPNGIIAMGSFVFSLFLIFYCIVGFFKVSEWSNALLLRAIYGVSIVVAFVCITRFLKDYQNYKKVVALKNSFNKLSMFKKWIEQEQENLQKQVQDSSNILNSSSISKEKQNKWTLIQVEQAKLKQQLAKKRIKKVVLFIKY